MDKVDFVVIWVDGSDKKWLKEKNKYSSVRVDVSNSVNRFRDWDILKYWFRGVEKYAPWVNNIYFVTWGHLPKWLNTENSKLKIVNHKDFIPDDYLPTFSSHTIELNLHRIKGLSENFVYFNDDMFIINEVNKEDYFKNGVPVNNFYETVNLPYLSNNFSKTCFNNAALLNDIFNKRYFYRKYFSKIFNLKNGFNHIVQSLFLLPYPLFCGMGVIHGSSSMKKESYEFLWDKYYDKFHNTCLHKFRNYDLDVNQYVIKDYAILKGDFCVRNYDFIKIVNVENENQIATLKKSLFGNKNKELCVNDNLDIEGEESDKIIKQVQEMFAKKFPDKCSFEK